MERWQIAVIYIAFLVITIVPAWILFSRIENKKPEIQGVQPRIEVYPHKKKRHRKSA